MLVRKGLAIFSVCEGILLCFQAVLMGMNSEQRDFKVHIVGEKRRGPDFKADHGNFLASC